MELLVRNLMGSVAFPAVLTISSGQIPTFSARRADRMARPTQPAKAKKNMIDFIFFTLPGLFSPTDEDDEGVEVEVALALALRLVLGPDDGQHAQCFGDEDHGARGLVDAVLVEVVELLLQQDLGVGLVFVGQG